MIDVTDQTFPTAVIERSKTVPVVVDLWAPWCEPCKTLGPIIEQVCAATNGAVELAKVNVDENPQVSQAFQVQGIPAVFAIVDGQVADHFVGAKGVEEVTEFVNKLVPEPTLSEIELLVLQGDEASLRAALELEPDNQAAVLALAELLVTAGNPDGGLEILARIPENPESRRIAALARTGAGATDDVDAKLADLLTRVKGDDDARQQFVDLLEVMGAGDPRTAEWRKKLTATLY